MVLGDGAYGDITELRSGLTEREIAYVLDVKAVTSAYPQSVAPETPARKPGRGRPPAARYRADPSSLRDLALGAGEQAAVEIEWREGTRGPMRSRFLAVRISRRTSSCAGPRTPHAGELDVALAARRVAGRQGDEPTKYWLSNLPARHAVAQIWSRPRAS